MAAKPAARMSDMHVCPLTTGTVPHVGGVILTGSTTVIIGGLPAARIDDTCMCMGAVDYVANGSLSVFIDSKPAARFTDTCFHGGFISAGCPTVLFGDPTTNYWTIAGILSVLCPKDKKLVERIRNKEVKLNVFRRIYYEDPYYDGTKWTTRHFEGGGSSDGTQITMQSGGSDGDAATTLYHEMDHHDQPPMPMREAEYETYAKTEEWTIDRGLPSQADPAKYKFRKKDSKGKTVVDKKEIKRFVDDLYPQSTEPSTSSPSAPPDLVIDKTPSGDTILERPDKTTYTRPPKKGDTFPGPEITEGERVFDPSVFKC